MRPFTIFQALLLLLALVSGCHKLLGDYEVEEAAASGCEPDSSQCVGNVLQRCDKKGTSWNNTAVCASEALCDAAQDACRPPMCGPGERRCQGAELQICNASRDGWDGLQTCDTAGRCSGQSGSCTDEPCEPGMLQCNGPLLQSCKDDRSGWNPEETCASAVLCDKDAGCSPAPCQAGEFNCEGAQLRVCNDTSSGWTAVRTCNSAALCDAKSGSCGSVACTTAGAFSCGDDGSLQRCADDLTGYVVLAACESPAHCDAVNGACTPEPCQPGARQCSGATLEQCKADRSGWEERLTCDTDALCQQTLASGADTCAAPACDADDVRCVAEQPEICNAGRTGYRANGAACVTAALCNAGSGTCNVPICMPNDARCTGAQPEICNPGLTGFVANGPACASAALCNATTGTCGDKKCSAGQLRCDPANPTHLQRCKPDFTGWEATPCDICDTPELCTVSLSTQPAVCTASACTAPTCALTDRWCGGTGNTGLYQCPPSRINSRAILLGNCASAELCEISRQAKKTTCEAPRCNAGQTQCAGTGDRTLRACNSGRTGFSDCATCASAQLCTDSLGTTTCNASACLVCSVGEARCNAAGDYETCRADRKGFNVTDCLGNGCDEATGCLTPGSGGAGG